MKRAVRVGLIGFGAIGRTIASQWRQRMPAYHELAAVCVRESQMEDARALLPATVVTVNIDEFLACAPELVVEAAGQSVIREHGERLMLSGCELWVLSVGALADLDVADRMTRAAQQSASRIGIPAGALAGFDGLMAMRQAGLQSVTYTSVKPPEAWRGTVAEERHRLDQLQQQTTLFRGSAREAALRFPKNANLAAAVALAGIGFEETVVELIADPRATGNTGRICAAGALGTMDMTVCGPAADHNPKTSGITSMSVIAALENRASVLAFV